MPPDEPRTSTLNAWNLTPEKISIEKTPSTRLTALAQIKSDDRHE